MTDTFDVVHFTLGSAVADAGTFTVNYPSGRNSGSYTFGKNHQLVSNRYGVLKALDSKISLAFGASSITVTNSTGAALAANTEFWLQLDRIGEDAIGEPVLADDGSMAKIHPVMINLGAPDTADSDGVCESQSGTADTAMTLNGDLVSGGVATFDVPRNVVAAWTNTAVLTIVGTDVFGNVMQEVSASGTSHVGKKAFKTITSVTPSANITSATVGTADVLGLPVFVEKASQIIAEFRSGVQTGRAPGKVYIQDHMLEAAADAGTSLELVSPVNGNITKLTTVARGTITTGGAITVEVNTTAVDGLSVTVADAAAAGDVDSDTPTAGHASRAVSVGDRIEIIPASEFNASADIFCILEIELDDSDVLDGTLVAGIQAISTGTTGDVRGTYDPAIACDGSTDFSLLVNLPDIGDKGVAQYNG